MQKVKDYWNTHVDSRVVTSTVVGIAIFGGIVYGLNKSGVKVLKQGATVAKGGK